MKWTRQLAALSSPTQQWNIGVVNRPIHSFIDEKDYEVEWLPKLDKRFFLADPFGVTINNNQYVFMEQYDRVRRKGKISYIKPNEKHKSLKIKTAFDPPHHISYPYTFQHKNEVYCVPETYVNNEVVIYKVKSPSNWEKEHIILKGIDAVDPSLIEFDGKWWLFFSRDKVSERANLYIWHAEDLFGDWVPHKDNPVKSDIRSSRPGGTLFVHEGELYRPAQDCGEYYGANVVINKVVKISPTEFLEKRILTISPSDSTFGGVHTLSSFGDLTLIDGFKFIGRDKLWLRDRILTVTKHLSRKLNG